MYLQALRILLLGSTLIRIIVLLLLVWIILLLLLIVILLVLLLVVLIVTLVLIVTTLVLVVVVVVVELRVLLIPKDQATKRTHQVRESIVHAEGNVVILSSQRNSSLMIKVMTYCC